MIDLVDEVEKLVRIEPVLGHQAAHRRAIALVIILLDAERVLARHLEIGRDELADALVDLVLEIEMMRVERVVEIEHPGLDPGEVTELRGCVNHH